MHVGILHYAAPPVVGGVELTIFHHARVLTALGHQVTVVAGKGDAVQPGVTYHDEPLAGSRHEAIIQVGQQLASGTVPTEFEALVSQTKAALQSHLAGCDVVIGHNLFTLHKNLVLTAAVHQLATSGTGPKWVAWHHDFAWLRPQYQPELHPGPPWELLRQPWPNVRHVTVSAAQQADLATLYDIPLDDITVVSPGVEPTEFYRCSETVGRLVDSWGLLEADAVFLLPARITRRKNIELGLRWMGAIRAASGWDARLVITGPPGPHNPANAAYLEELLVLQREQHLESAVHFVYEESSSHAPLLLSDEDVANFYQVADAMLFPSRQEGFGIPVLEAALARLPVFATDLPPFHESGGPYVNLFPLDQDPAAVGHAIVQRLESNTAYQLRRRILRQFTWQGVMKNTILPLLTQASESV